MPGSSDVHARNTTHVRGPHTRPGPRSGKREARIREAYPTATYERLAEVKRRYDPSNLFRFNQNIRPAPRAS